mgnify:CR=1 FL=1
MLSLLAALFLVAQPADEPRVEAAEPEPPPPSMQGGPPKPAPLAPAEAVDADGVPAWAKRKHKQPVQACETRPNIGIETWRQRLDSADATRLKPRPDMNTCKRL